MVKKINSEYKIKNDDNAFSVTMGTADKKNPEIIYTILNTYITSLSTELTTDGFLNIEKTIKKYINNLIATSNICNNNTIIVCDCAYNRIRNDKPTFLNVQIYFKVSNDCSLKFKHNFKNISNEIYNTYIKKITKYIENLLISNDLFLSKNNIKHSIKQ